MSKDIHHILKQYWGFDSFRPLQEEIIHSVLADKDTLALLPTGGGKSLCYQVPAMAKDGLCLVISPLIALMKDQVENLRKKNITAFAIYSGMSRKEVINTLKVATNSNCKFLYVSPERLETNLFKEYLPALDINLIAVDEAHCISQWGYDFRPPYLRIAVLREELKNTPVLALTASATEEVQKDITEKLSPPTPLKGGSKENFSTSGKEKHSDDWRIFRQSFERNNLSYSVFKVDAKINKIIEIISNVAGSGIIYCKSRKRTREISDLLQLQQVSSDYYHAGLSQEERNRKQENWIQNKTRIIVCTNAFGMGIDKPDVRTVIHSDVPDCLENYYQEAGRAGRDGKKAYAVLLYDERDIKELEQSASVRFPSIEDIRNVYQSICNYLQIPSGSGEGQWYDFDLSDCIKKFKLNSHTALYSLKALEQDGWMSFTEQVFIPSQVQFVVNKENLYQFEQDHISLEPLIKALLRAYEGIFDYPANISEWTLAGLLKKDITEIKKELTQLHHYSIIRYQPQKDKPQLVLLKNRVKKEDLLINITQYKIRKEKYTARSRNMISYVQNNYSCRSKFIGNYFGDHVIKNCGICDNCLKQKATVLSAEEFDQIQKQIIQLLGEQKTGIKDLLSQLKNIKKEKIWKVIDFLQAEDKIRSDEKGVIRLKE